jgi:hypothetical protein
MNWLVKVAAFKFLSGLPGGSGFYGYCQERITRSTESDLRELAIPIHECFNRYSKEELGAKHLFFVAERA